MRLISLDIHRVIYETDSVQGQNVVGIISVSTTNDDAEISKLVPYFLGQQIPMRNKDRCLLRMYYFENYNKLKKRYGNIGLLIPRCFAFDGCQTLRICYHGFRLAICIISVSTYSLNTIYPSYFRNYINALIRVSSRLWVPIQTDEPNDFHLRLLFRYCRHIWLRIPLNISRGQRFWSRICAKGIPSKFTPGLEFKSTSIFNSPRYESKSQQLRKLQYIF